MFRTICDLIPDDRDFPARTRRLEIFKRVLDGTLYDVLNFEFFQERTSGGEYIPLRHRRPSVKYALARVVVEDSVALLFSDGHFPTVDSSDHQVRDALIALTRNCRLNSVMTEAALRGSIGSAAILLRLLAGRIHLRVLDASHLNPIWRPDAPDMLESVTERIKVTGADLTARGYRITDAAASYWFERRWDKYWETWYIPIPVGGNQFPQVDDGRSVRHGLGFVPIAWIQNLPGGQDFDGSCTFEAAIETSIEIDYQLSQVGRGLKYCAADHDQFGRLDHASKSKLDHNRRHRGEQRAARCIVANFVERERRFRGPDRRHTTTDANPGWIFRAGGCNDYNARVRR